MSYYGMLKWRKRGQAEIDRLEKDNRAKPKKSEIIYVEFVNALKAAIAESEANIIAEIRAHGKKSWVALAWLAERRWPQRWARPERIEHTGKDGGPIKTEISPQAQAFIQAITAERKNKK